MLCILILVFLDSAEEDKKILNRIVVSISYM
jgi:hypothetical protein